MNMDVLGINVVFLVVVSFWKLPDISASEACSCYSFHGNSSSKQVSRQYCQEAGGDLVSIETTEEESFIQNQLQNKTIENGSIKEYWIGLEREGGNWKWVNNNTEQPTINVWGSLPNESERKTFFTIAYHSANSSLYLHAFTNETISKGWICEYKNKDCKIVQEDIVCKEMLARATSTTITITTTMSTHTTTIPATTAWITTTTTTTKRPTTVVNTVTSVNKTRAPPTINTTTKPKIVTAKPEPTEMSPKVAKLTSAAAPVPSTTTASATERPFFEDTGILTTTSPVHECLSDPYVVVAISVSVIGGATVLFFAALFLFVACRSKCSRPRQKIEKIEMEEGEYENHL